MKKILFLAANYPPYVTEGSSRASRIASNLPSYGWEPLVVAPPAFLPAPPPASGNEEGRVYRTGEPFDVASFDHSMLALFARGEKLPAPGRVPKIISGFFAAEHPLASWEREAGRVAERIIREHPDIEAIYAGGPPVAPLLLALELSAKHSIPALFDLTAPLDSTFLCPALPPSRAGDVAKLEERLLTSGYSVVTPTRSLKEYFLKKYFGKLTHDDLTIVPDSFNDALARLPAPTAAGGGRAFRPLFFLERVDGREAKLFFSSLSSFVESRDAARGLLEPVVVCRDEELAAKFMKKYRLEGRIRVACTASETEELELCRNSDAVGVVTGIHPENTLWLPGRLIDAAGMQRALFAVAPEGALKQFCLEASALYAESGALKDLLSTLHDGRHDLRRFTPRPELLARYSIERTLGDLAKTIAFMLPL